MRAVRNGITAGLLLLAFYLLSTGLISRSWTHAWELLLADRYYVAAIAAGFGTQVGLYSALRRRKAACGRGVRAVAASGTGASTGAMIACCLHHLADVLPVLGLAGAAIFFERYKYPVMWLGIGVNLLGIVLLWRMLRRQAA